MAVLAIFARAFYLKMLARKMLCQFLTFLASGQYLFTQCMANFFKLRIHLWEVSLSHWLRCFPNFRVYWGLTIKIVIFLLFCNAAFCWAWMSICRLCTVFIFLSDIWLDRFLRGWFWLVLRIGFGEDGCSVLNMLNFFNKSLIIYDFSVIVFINFFSFLHLNGDMFSFSQQIAHLLLLCICSDWAWFQNYIELFW